MWLMLIAPTLPSFESSWIGLIFEIKGGVAVAIAARHHKGMYQPLTALVRQFGSFWLYNLQPSILTSSLQSMEQEGHCQAATNFLRSLLSGLLRHCKGRMFIPILQALPLWQNIQYCNRADMSVNSICSFCNWFTWLPIHSIIALDCRGCYYCDCWR